MDRRDSAVYADMIKIAEGFKITILPRIKIFAKSLQGLNILNAQLFLIDWKIDANLNSYNSNSVGKGIHDKSHEVLQLIKKCR